MVLTLSACATVRVAIVDQFTSADGRFSVTVPGGMMNETVLPAPTSGAFAGATPHAFSITTVGGPQFAVLYGDAASDYLAATTMDAALDVAEHANVVATQGTLVTDQAISVAGHPGREQLIAAGQVSYLFRFVFVGNRLYSVSVKGSPVQIHAADAKVFLDSLLVEP